MAKRQREPEEALGPTVDGLRGLELIFTPGADLPAMPEETLPAPEEDELAAEPVVLIFGHSPEAEAVATLARACDFQVTLASQAQDGAPAWADTLCVAPGLERIVERCGIDRNYFVCIFLDDPEECELILSQCLASDAYYLGLNGDREKCRAVFARLREDGAPDAELAPIAAPMGLDLGADTPEQAAVAIVAEMLAVKAGKLVGSRHKK